MDLPDLTGVAEKLGAAGAMLFGVFFLLWQNIRAESSKAITTPDAPSGRLAGMEENIKKVPGLEAAIDALEIRCSQHERKMDRVYDRARQFDDYAKQVTILWDRDQSRRSTERR